MIGRSSKQSSSVRSLSVWLDRVTHGLAPEEIDRIVAEISEHYRDVFDDATDSGTNPTQAHIEAMRSLGDPDAARRAFLKTHLTAWEVDCLGKLENRSYEINRNPWVGRLRLTASILLAGVWIAMGKVINAHPLVIGFVLGLQFIAIIGATGRILANGVSREHPRYPLWFGLRVIGVLVWIVPTIFFLWFLSMLAPSEFGWFCLAIIILILVDGMYHLIQSIVAVRGLRKVVRKNLGTQ